MESLHPSVVAECWRLFLSGLPKQIMHPAQKLGRPSVLDLINTAVSCLSTVLHYRTSPSSYLTLPWCHLTLPLSLSPSFSLGFIGRARICMSSDAHMLGHFLIVFHIKQPRLMWSCTGTAHVKISGQLGLGRGKADTCLHYKWRSILLESKNKFTQKCNTGSLEKHANYIFCETPKTFLLYPYKLLQYPVEMNIRDS